MEEKLWKQALTVGGLPSIGLFLYWSLNKDWLTLPIFSELTSEHTYQLMILFLCFTFGTPVYFGWIHYKTHKQNSANKVDSALEVCDFPFDPQGHRSDIEKVIYEKRNITGFDLSWTGLRNDNNFLEFCLKDFSETWLIQEIPSPVLSGELKRQIKIVNRHLSSREDRHKDVLIILLVYRNLSNNEKASLFSQFQLFQSTESLSSKLRFNVWDKSDIDRILHD